MDCLKCIAMKYCYSDGIKIANTDQVTCDFMQKCSSCSHSKNPLPGFCQLFLFKQVKDCVCLQCFLKPLCSYFCDERTAQFDMIKRDLQQYNTKNF